MTRFVIIAAALALALTLALAARPAPETSAERVDRISALLRCPVCQGLSVRDSPSETARSMRDLVVQRVSEDRSDAQIRDEFRASYGEWVFLDPPLLGLTGLVWLAPLALVAGGLWAAWRFTKRSPPPALLDGPDALEVAALWQRIARDEAADA